MIKTIEPHANISVPSIERMLFVLHPAALEMIKQRRRWHIRHNLLHHRANPRSVEYMLEFAGDFKARYAPNASVDLLTASSLDQAVSEKHHSWIGQIWAGTSVEGLVEKDYDTVVFLYADAIGLGWEDVEKSLRRLRAPQYLALNGRRRIFVWDMSSHRALALRRFVARTRGVELLLTVSLLGVAPVFALYDALTGRFQKKDERG